MGEKQEKQVVQFSKIPIYYHKSDYILYCKSCHSYHLNDGKPCYKCGSSKGSMTLEEIASKTVKRNFLNKMCIGFIIYGVLFLLSMTFSNIIGVSLYTVVCLGANLLIYKAFKKDLVMAEFEKYIYLNAKEIKKDLAAILKKAARKVEDKAYLEAYEDLRYLGMVIDEPSLRINKLMCLKEFRLRKDLPLEMKEILIKECNRYLIYYIYEISQIKKELIDDATITYILKYKGAILEFSDGRQIIATVLGAALKSKMLTNKYAQELCNVIDYLPKERIIRLCKIKDCIQDEALKEQMISKVRLKYGYDETTEKYL